MYGLEKSLLDISIKYNFMEKDLSPGTDHYTKSSRAVDQARQTCLA